MTTSENYSRLLSEAEQTSSDDDGIVLANLREWRHEFDRASKLPNDLVKKASETSSLAKQAWKQARKADDFSIFAPHLAKLLDIARQMADRWGFEDEPYSALLGKYERGASTSSIGRLFDSCRDELVSIAAKATEKSAANAPRNLTGSFPTASQQQLNREVAESIGFDFEAGRIDTTTHPFCSGLSPYDVRLTTRYYDHTFIPSLFGVMHEAGHGLYDQGLIKEEYSRPAGISASLGIHESQSLLWENHIGRSKPFWEKWLPRVKEFFPQLGDWSTQDIVNHINTAKYSFIRVDADEATYDLHILLRFAIERKMINGEVAVNEIPELWKSEFSRLFGMTPESDTVGCLQDIHWAMGGIGYFSTYSLGNFNASQLFHFAQQDQAVATGCDNADYSALLS